MRAVSAQPSMDCTEIASRSAAHVARLLQALVSAPSWLFLAALAIMLFRPPDLPFYSLDRYGFLLLVFVVGLRALVLRQVPAVSRLVLWPMGGLVLLALWSVFSQPYDVQAWSVFAAKWLVPFTLFILAGLVFDGDKAWRQLEVFSLLVLAYLCFVSIAFLFNANSLIFPGYILNESLGIHTDRARGPFLQAVANGVTLNLLGLVALDSYRRGRLRGWPAFALLLALPLATLATKTRAVWLSFTGSVLLLLFFSREARVRKTCLLLTLLGCLIPMALMFVDGGVSLVDRLEDRGTVEFRVEVYDAGWQMFLEKPVFGWGANSMQPELAKRISGFHQEFFYVHNSYLEILAEHGLAGLGLYIWLVTDLFRLGRAQNRAPEDPSPFVDFRFLPIWRLMLLVYLLNASFVVMNYQFVNGMLFTFAGLLAVPNRRRRTLCVVPS